MADKEMISGDASGRRPGRRPAGARPVGGRKRGGKPLYRVSSINSNAKPRLARPSRRVGASRILPASRANPRPILGQNVSSGCIRMLNADVIDLYIHDCERL